MSESANAAWQEGGDNDPVNQLAAMCAIDRKSRGRLAGPILRSTHGLSRPILSVPLAPFCEDRQQDNKRN